MVKNKPTLMESYLDEEAYAIATKSNRNEDEEFEVVKLNNSYCNWTKKIDTFSQRGNEKM